jgi:hypothetical protein
MPRRRCLQKEGKTGHLRSEKDGHDAERRIVEKYQYQQPSP